MTKPDRHRNRQPRCPKCGLLYVLASTLPPERIEELERAGPHLLYAPDLICSQCGHVVLRDRWVRIKDDPRYIKHQQAQREAAVPTPELLARQGEYLKAAWGSCTTDEQRDLVNHIIGQLNQYGPGTYGVRLSNRIWKQLYELTGKMPCFEIFNSYFC